MAEEQAKETKETVEAKETKKTKDASAKKWSSDIKKLGDKIVALTLMQAKELGDYLKEEHGIEPVSIVKAVRDLTDQVAAQAIAEEKAEYRSRAPLDMPRDELARVIKELEKQMHGAAESLAFEKAAALRDQIFELRQTLAEMDDLPPWQRVRVMAGEDQSEL